MQAVAGGIGTSQPSLGVMRAVASSATPGRPGRCCIAVVGRTPVRLPAPCIVWFVAVAMANLCSQPSHSLLGNVLQQYKISQKLSVMHGRVQISTAVVDRKLTVHVACRQVVCSAHWTGQGAQHRSHGQ